MTRRSRRRCSWLALLLLVAASGARAAEPSVILLSWDGVRPDYLDRVELPALARLAEGGARAERLIPVFPTNTFPNHVSLATGTYPDRHGIVGNVFRDRKRGVFDYENDASWLLAEPLWVAAERQGVPAAVFFWVGSETDWNGVGATHRKSPFDGSVPESDKVDQILAWLALPEERRPRLVMAWWHGADRAGHRRGPGHASVGEAMARQDRELGRLLAGLDARQAWQTTTLIVVSDHGMTEVSKIVDLEGVLSRAGVAADVLPSAAFAHVYVEDPAQLERARRALAEVEAVRVYRSGRLPDRLRYDLPDRSGDLVVLTDPPHSFVKPRGFAAAAAAVSSWLGGRLGMHGYDPAHPDMAGIFLAYGRGVPRGARPGPVRAIDVAPSVARLLGIEPPRDAEGAPIPGIGAP